MVKRTPRKRNAAAAEAVVGEKASGEDEMEEEGEKSLETEEEKKGANVIEENPLFEEEDQGEDEEENVGGEAEKLDSSSSTLEDLGGSSTSRYKLKRSRQVARREDTEVPAKESQEGDKLEGAEEEEPMEIASVETVADVAVDEDEPMTKKSKQQLEDDKGETAKAKVLEENIQPEKLKVVELRNQLKVTIESQKIEICWNT